MERTFAWLHSFRRVVTRLEKDIGRYDGFVHLACAFIARGRLVKQPCPVETIGQWGRSDGA